MTKICSTCKIELSLNSTNFEPRKKSIDGFRNQCRNCRNKMRRENYVSRDGTSFWTPEEKSILEKFYPMMPAEEIHNKYLPSRTVSQINDHAIKKLKLSKNDDYVMGWSKEQISYLVENYENMKIDVDDIVNYLDKNKPTVIAMANKLNLYRIAWSESEKEIVKKFYPLYKTDEFRERYLPNKSITQIIGFANKNNIYKTYEFKVNVALRNLRKLNENSEMTKPESITEDLLKQLNIKYDCQHYMNFYWMDFYLPEHNLIIEVQGDYFHCHPLKNFTYNVLNKNKILRKDKSKHSYVKNKFGIEILYLWEDDLMKNKDLCAKLITEYIRGNLDNYHSYNFTLLNNNIIINDDLIAIGY